MSTTPCMISNVCFPATGGFTCSDCGKTFGAGQNILVEWCFLPDVPMADHHPVGVYHADCYRHGRKA